MATAMPTNPAAPVERIVKRELQQESQSFPKDVGLCASVLPFVSNLPCLALPGKPARKQRLVILFSPDGVVPNTFWPEAVGSAFEFKESMKPLEPFKDRTLVLRGVSDKVRGDGDNHMRGIGCLLTGIELFPGNVQGGGDTPAGWSSGHSIDQEIKTFLQSNPATRTRFGSLEFGVMVPEHADTWTRMCYAGPNDRSHRSTIPIRCSASSMARRKTKRCSRASSTICGKILRRCAPRSEPQDRKILDEHTSLVREMEQDIHASRGSLTSATRCRSSSREFDGRTTISRKISKLQIDLLVSSFLGDAARVATLQFTNSVGDARMTWLGIQEGQHGLSHEPDGNKAAQDKLTRINAWYCSQLAYLAKRLAETPEPDGQGTLLDNTLIVWTNELGKGNSHTLEDIPFVLVGNGLAFKMGRSLNFGHVPHNRLLLSLADGFGHRIDRFGNPDYCAAGPLPNLT